MRTPQEILDQTNGLAARFYECFGYESPEGFRFDKSYHPHEQTAWRQACIAQEVLTYTDMDNVIDDIEEDEPPF